MGNEPAPSQIANTTFIWVSVAGAAGSVFVATMGGRFAGGWPLAAMVAAPAFMALGIVYLISRNR